MMTHERQIGDECFLAALAMASGVPYRTMRRRKLPSVWREGVRKRRWRNWEPVFGALAVEYGIDLWPCVAYVVFPYDEWRLDRLDGRKVRGRGVLFLTFPPEKPKRKVSYHAVAYEDGLVYDSNEDGPLTVQEYVELTTPISWLRARCQD